MNEEINKDEEKLTRDEKKQLSNLKIITAINLGKDRNKDIAKFLDTDKSFAAKKVKELEEKGLVIKEGEGKNVRYRVNEFNVLSFLKSKVIITKSRIEKEVIIKEEINENGGKNENEEGNNERESD